MYEPIDCRGDPRAMGLAQGVRCREGVRAHVDYLGIGGRRSPWLGLRPLTSGRVLGRGPGREIIRHSPHLSERIQGLARGAGLPFETLMELFLRAADSDAPGGALSPEAVVILAGGVAGTGIVVTRALIESGLPGSTWIVRRSRPDVGFVSLEVTLPWFAAAVAGVNERGLAVALAPCGSASQPAGCHRAALASLVQECLQRFSEIRSCADWCRKRPASGRAAILAADASGSALSVEIEGMERKLVRLEGHSCSVAGSRELCRWLRAELAAGDAGIEDLVRCQAARLGDSRRPSGWLIALEPDSRCLTLYPLSGGGDEAPLRFALGSV